MSFAKVVSAQSVNYASSQKSTKRVLHVSDLDSTGMSPDRWNHKLETFFFFWGGREGVVAFFAYVPLTQLLSSDHSTVKTYGAAGETIHGIMGKWRRQEERRQTATAVFHSINSPNSFLLSNE